MIEYEQATLLTCTLAQNKEKERNGKTHTQNKTTGEVVELYSVALTELTIILYSSIVVRTSIFSNVRTLRLFDMLQAGAVKCQRDLPRFGDTMLAIVPQHALTCYKLGLSSVGGISQDSAMRCSRSCPNMLQY